VVASSHRDPGSLCPPCFTCHLRVLLFTDVIVPFKSEGTWNPFETEICEGLDSGCVKPILSLPLNSICFTLLKIVAGELQLFTYSGKNAPYSVKKHNPLKPKKKKFVIACPDITGLQITPNVAFGVACRRIIDRRLKCSISARSRFYDRHPPRAQPLPPHSSYYSFWVLG
jgi:hypothetical protein